MGQNRGKQFEDVIRSCFKKIPGVSIDRLHDQTTGYAGSTNICDLIVYQKPYEYYFECKSVHGNTLSIHSVPKPDKKGVLHGSYGNISDKQWEGLLEKSKIEGVTAGVICWWVDKDVTKFIPIQLLQTARESNCKSIRYDDVLVDARAHQYSLIIEGHKKRVFFDYDMIDFLHQLEKFQRRRH